MRSCVFFLSNCLFQRSLFSELFSAFFEFFYSCNQSLFLATIIFQYPKFLYLSLFSVKPSGNNHITKIQFYNSYFFPGLLQHSNLPSIKASNLAKYAKTHISTVIQAHHLKLSIPGSYCFNILRRQCAIYYSNIKPYH